MRAKTCGMSADEKHFRRLHYCGTCKTIGSLYSQKSRFLLNHDTIFLAEILSGLSGENAHGWQKAYQSFNCLSLPEKEMPLSLQFAATANLVLTEFKLADKVADENSSVGKIAQKSFSTDFQKARKHLERWQFPFGEIQRILSAQQAIENGSSQSNESTDEILNKLSRPTAETTAIFFREGVKLIGKGDIGNLASEIGFKFGKLIYLLDAFEDYEKDFRGKQFNAFRVAFDLSQTELSGEDKRRIVSILRGLESEISEKLRELPIAENQKTLFIQRLSNNLQRKLKTELPVLQAKQACSTKRKIHVSNRWQTAKATARALAQDYRWQMPLVFLFVFIFAVIAPAQTREAKSVRECFDLSFNLMFLGAFASSILAFPKAILMQNLPPENFAAKAEKKEKEGWCDWCDCDCCCCDCDGCGCDGCGCDCDGCDCCCCDCNCG